MPNQPAQPNDPLKGKKTGKWTKYGGAIYGLEKEMGDTWFCQTCGDEIPKELPPFNYELYPGEFIRICNICKAKVDMIDKPREVRIKRVITIRRTKRD